MRIVFKQLKEMAADNGLVVVCNMPRVYNVCESYHSGIRALFIGNVTECYAYLQGYTQGKRDATIGKTIGKSG